MVSLLSEATSSSLRAVFLRRSLPVPLPSLPLVHPQASLSLPPLQHQAPKVLRNSSLLDLKICYITYSALILFCGIYTHCSSRVDLATVENGLLVPSTFLGCGGFSLRCLGASHIRIPRVATRLLSDTSVPYLPFQEIINLAKKLLE